VKASTLQLADWLEVRRKLVDEALQQWLPCEPAVPEPVAAAMRYSLFAGGKRLRPMLVLATAESCADATGSDADRARELALPAACAIEMIHTYSLVHDDLPAMDDDTMRRGRPTSHVVFGEGMAILAGDGLLTEAFALLAREPHGGSPDLQARKLRVVEIVADAAGAAGMVGGQALDLAAAAPGAPRFDRDALRAMHARKTGALIRAAARAGATMAGADDVLLEAVDEYGEAIGLAFQIVDDILDVEGASADLGKTAGKDAAAGKPTYPALYGLAASRTLAAECVGRATAALDRGGLAGQLPAIARWVTSRTQ
jgi:geranylgeranyl diphosphate synthase, type II